MKNKQISRLCGDGRSVEVKHWQSWLAQLPELRCRVSQSYYEFDPFQWNETASVAMLGNAASMAGLIALTEYSLPKRQATRGRPFRNGRCDLWIADVKKPRSWAFEFKQHFARPGMRKSTFEKHLNQAYQDAKSVDRGEADYRYGGLILVPKDFESHDDQATMHFDDLCETADLAFRIPGAFGPIWLAFKMVK